MTTIRPDSNGSPLWWQSGVIYQIYPRSFQDSNADGVGDLPGIASRLDYLQALGVDAIWLSPIYPSPMADFGYDVADYTAVHPIFGTMADFDALLAQTHAAGLRLILDFVPNHTSDQHPWFVESRSSRHNPRHDWYMWADARPDGSPPNNWLSVFGGPAWEWDGATGQYYLHSFLKQQPDLNWRNPAVKAAMFDAVRFWLDRGVDGFRIDVAHYIMKDPQLRDNPPSSGDGRFIHKPIGEYDTQLHLYDHGHPDVHTVYRELRQVLGSYDGSRPRMAVGEIHLFDWQEWASYYGRNLDELHMPFNFGLLKVEWQARAVRQLVDTVEAVLPAGAWPNYVLSNHDESRIPSRYGLAGARLAAMLRLTLRGTPTLYYGDELGMADVPIPPDREQDPWGKREPGLGVGRDPERTPMQWDDSPNAGFTPANVEPWLPVSPDYRTVNVQTERDDPASMLNLYWQLLAWRRQSPALHSGSYQPVEQAPDDCFVYLRRRADECVLVALNFSNQEQRLNLRAFGEGKVLVSTRLDRAERVRLADLSLGSSEGVLIGLSS